jgi:hypothetical protein
MKNVLIVGCSHSRGSYFIDNETKLEKIDRSEIGGWWSFIPVLTDYKKTVYANGGTGWVWYAELLHQLSQEDNLLNYDMCIIQETYEPRLHITNTHPLKYEMHNFKQCNTTLYDGSVATHSLFSNHPPNYNMIIKNRFPNSRLCSDYLIQTNFSPTYHNLVASSKMLVSELMNFFKIPTYIWQMHHPVDDLLYYNNNFIDLGLVDMYSKLLNHTTSEELGAHLTVSGNIELGKQINKALMNNKMFWE